MTKSSILSCVRKASSRFLALSITELFVWVMPGIALLIGFFIYTAYVRRNRKAPAPLTPVDQALIDRFQTQIDRELGESKK